MPHDQLFKELLHTFFREFVEMFFPEIASRLDFTRVTFLENELFTDLPEGSLRRPDFVAEVYTLDGVPELFLLHIEIQYKRERDVVARMSEYYALLRGRYRILVFPVILYLSPGAGGITEEVHTERLFERDILTFRCAVIGLPDLSADDYLDIDNPLAALSALMRPSRLGKLAQKIQSYQHAFQSPVDEAKKSLLFHVIETYLKLSTNEEQTFQKRLAQDQLREVGRMLTIFEERGMVRGIIEAKREDVLTLMREKFGELPTQIVSKVEKIDSRDELDSLLKRILTANSPEEMGL